MERKVENISKLKACAFIVSCNGNEKASSATSAYKWWGQGKITWAYKWTVNSPIYKAPLRQCHSCKDTNPITYNTIP